MRIPELFRACAGVGLSLLLALFCSACAGDYSQAVTAFAQATTASKDAFAESRRILADDSMDRLLARAKANPDSVIPAAKECDPVRPVPCHLVLIPGEASLRQSDLYARMAQLPALLDAYAQALKAITEADTAANVKASVDKVNGSIENIAKAVDKENVTAFATFSKPVSALVGWGFGEYIAIVKEHAVRDAATKADPWVKEAAKAFGAFAQSAAALGRNKEFENFLQRKRAYESEKTEAALQAWLEAAASLDRISTAPDSKVMNDLAEAHAALVRSFDDPASLREAFARFQSVRDQANALADILKSLREAARMQKQNAE